MTTMDEIARERLALAELLETLNDDQWQTPSLCSDWTVREVAGHLVMPMATPLRSFAVAVVKARGNFDVANDRTSRAFARRPVSQIISGLRDNAENRFHPPTFGHEAPMSELILHGQDIRRPLGLAHEFSPEALRTSLDMLVSPKALRGFVPKRLRLHDGLRFEASDVDWSSGAGELISGPGASLAFAMTGRTASIGELSGPGVAVLRSR